MENKLFVLLAVLCLIGSTFATSNVICYHGTWSFYRSGNGRFLVADTPVDLCTHYIYSFFGLNGTSFEVISLDSFLDIDSGNLEAAIALKERNPDLKVLYSIGGWNQGSANYSNMVSSEANRAIFINSALNWVQTYGFDGVDMDWEYPARRDSTNPANDKANFALLIREFHEAFNPLNLTLTVTVSATGETADISYDVPTIAEYADILNIMTFDFHGAFDNFTGHNSPLYGAEKWIGTAYEAFNVNASVYAWLERGAIASKTNIAIPLYGRTNTLIDNSNTGVGAPANATGGPAGPYSAESGTLAYSEIILAFNESDWTRAWDDEQKVPYAYFNGTWLSYDNVDSVTLKAEYVKSLGLAGVMVWSIESEDLHGTNGTTFPLLKAIKSGLDSS